MPNRAAVASASAGMVSSGMLKQCRLTNGTTSQIAWIPSWAAKIGNEVELLPEGKSWAVHEIFGTIDATHLQNQRSARLSLGSIAVPTKP